MPSQPPVFKAPGARDRKPWQSNVYSSKRKRGRAGQRERMEILSAEPFCRICNGAGKLVRADVVDHITPLSWGGSDDRCNKQPLCQHCHDEKSKIERQVDRAAGDAANYRKD